MVACSHVRAAAVLALTGVGRNKSVVVRHRHRRSSLSSSSSSFVVVRGTWAGPRSIIIRAAARSPQGQPYRHCTVPPRAVRREPSSNDDDLLWMALLLRWALTLGELVSRGARCEASRPPPVQEHVARLSPAAAPLAHWGGVLRVPAVGGGASRARRPPRREAPPRRRCCCCLLPPLTGALARDSGPSRGFLVTRL